MYGMWLGALHGAKASSPITQQHMGKFLHCVGTACALRAYCARKGWDTHPSNTVGGDRIISLDSISEK